MIYLKNISEPQMVFVPKGRETEGNLSFSLKNTINQSVLMNASVADLQSDLYVQFSISLPADRASGEYEYTLTDDAGIVSTGLLIVDDLSSPTEYNNAIQYKQYE